MDLTHHCLEEFLQAPRGDSWPNFHTRTSEFFSNEWSMDSLVESTSLSTENPSLLGFSNPTQPSFHCPFNDQTYAFVDGFTALAEIDTSHTKNDTSPFPPQEEYPSMVEEEELGFLSNHSYESGKHSCKVEMEEASEIQGFSVGFCGEDKRGNSKKLEGHPSKNLMAERRRRKRLNDRLSMLRSIVPKISKMDRTSILGDTIDYMKELLERISKLQEEESEKASDQMNLVPNFKEPRSNEVVVRNSPKFHVERREIDTQIDISCATRPGLLLSTVNTLDALGLEIQQCVISCFNDFSMQASCSEETGQMNCSKLSGPILRLGRKKTYSSPATIEIQNELLAASFCFLL